MIYDLHAHTTASDGKLSPRELIDYAIERKLNGIAITDHDTTKGISEAITYAKDKKIEVIPGIEISCDCENKVKEVHIVGLFIDYKNPGFKKLTDLNRNNGNKKAKEIIEKLKPLGYQISLSELEEKNSFGKNTIAYLLLEKYPKDFTDRKDVFNKLLGWGQPAMVFGEGASIKDAIDVIHNSGGVAILAHPGQLREHDDYFINKFIKLGGDGIEVGKKYSYLNNAKELDIKYRKITKDNKLFISKGTDFHWKKDGKTLGDIGLNEEEFLKLKEYHQKNN